MGLLSPTEGDFVVDDTPVTIDNQRSWQLNIAHVPQTIFLSDTTIKENIAFGVPLDEININLVIAAARKAQISSSIESWKYKYNTHVGERGIKLSGGQRQRIGIARALYKKADVIILDEATSALDNKTEKAVMSELNNLDDSLTIFIVAHRLTTLENCDQIVELEDGKIKSISTYNEIIL